MRRDHEDESKVPPAENPLPEFVENSPFLRLLVFEKTFRKAMALLLLLAVAVPLSVFKIWKTSPPDFKPEVKVSGLDLAQVWSLRRAAEKHVTKHELPEAIAALKMAFGNNPANPESSRDLLRTLRDWEPVPWDQQNLARAQAFWLLRLTQTNAADLTLASEVFGHFRLDEYVVGLLGPYSERITDPQIRLLLPALFRQNEMEQFAGLLAKNSSLTNDPELGLYQAAWQAGWGPSATAGAGQRVLDAGMTDPKTAMIAHRLGLAVSHQLAQLDLYARSLRALQTGGSDRVADHARYWDSLARAGRKEEARTLFKEFNLPPNLPADSLLEAGALVTLGLHDDALRLLERHRLLFPSAAKLWSGSADLLIRLQRWDDLRSLAVNLRRITPLHDQTAGYTFYLEGVCAVHQGRPEAAEKAFQQISEVPFSNPALSYQTATGLNQLGRPKPARKLLESLESTFGGTLEYWRQVFQSAFLARDAAAMLQAAEKAWQIAPNHLVAINNLAASLLILRERPGQAVQLTLKCLSAAPRDPGMILNHALALLQNRRVDEGEQLLGTLPREGLTPLVMTMLNLGWLEVHLQRNRSTEALAAYHLLDPQHLLPPQRKWADDQASHLKVASP